MTDLTVNTTLHPITTTVRQGRGYRIIRRVRLHQPRQNAFQRLWLHLWTGGNPEHVHARTQRMQALKAQQHEHQMHRIFLP